MEELVEYEPGLFIIYSGNNEFLEKRTYEGLIEEPEALTRSRLLLQRTRIWPAARFVADRARRRARARYELTGEVQELLDSSAAKQRWRRTRATTRSTTPWPRRCSWLDEGQRHLERAFELNPGSAPAAADLALVLEHRGRPERALELYREAARLDPGLALAQEGMARLGQRPGGR